MYFLNTEKKSECLKPESCMKGFYFLPVYPPPPPCSKNNLESYEYVKKNTRYNKSKTSKKYVQPWQEPCKLSNSTKCSWKFDRLCGEVSLCFGKQPKLQNSYQFFCVPHILLFKTWLQLDTENAILGYG